MRRRRASTAHPFTVNEYHNRKGEPRVAVLMSLTTAQLIASGHGQPLAAFADALAENVFVPTQGSHEEEAAAMGNGPGVRRAAR